MIENDTTSDDILFDNFSKSFTDLESRIIYYI